MCVIYWTYGHPKYLLVIAANRDEFLNRPKKKADYWEEYPHVLGGIDLGNKDAENAERHGYSTWLGVTTTGRFSFVTNYREDPKTFLNDAISRGYLVRDFLIHEDLAPNDGVEEQNKNHSTTNRSARIGEHYMKLLHPQKHLYNGFNLVVGDIFCEDVWYAGNKDIVKNRPGTKLSGGVVYGVSNHVLVDSGSLGDETEGSFSLPRGDEWPKVRRGKRLFQEAINEAKTEDELVERLLANLSDVEKFPDDELQKGYNQNLERAVQSICVEEFQLAGLAYGTRTHTVVIVPRPDAKEKGGVMGRFVEVDRSVEHDGVDQRRDFKFELKK
ncbi:NRDE protein-domain-containing protein [Cladochytrium replicatum]|nr:NRDE protein-domain-containing protein [Cladochytrium replicatum]